MKYFRPLSLLLTLLIAPAFADDMVGQLHFINGDRLSGRPGSINENGHLILHAENLLHQPSEILIENLLDVRLEGGEIPVVDANHVALLELTNGDTLRGQLDGLTDEYVTLKTWYGGTLKIRRSMASSLEILRSQRAVYVGPDALENWTISGDEDAWTFKHGQLASDSTGCIAREIELPEKCHISFQLAWRSNLKFRLLLFSNVGDTATPENCYDLVCQRRFVYLRKRWMTRKSGGSRTIGQPANIRELAEKEKVTMDFYIDRKTGSVAFYVDGRRAQVWTDEDPEVGSFGNWLHFISEDDPLRISQMSAAPWKGDLPESPDPENEEEEPVDTEGQRIRLQNGDQVVGEVGDIENGVLCIKTKHADIKIPVDRMRSIALTSRDSPNYEEPIRKTRDVRAWLHEGGRITFQLRSFDGNSLTGYSQTFGEAKFDPNAFSRLEFNIHNEELDHKRAAPEW